MLSGIQKFLPINAQLAVIIVPYYSREYVDDFIANNHFSDIWVSIHGYKVSPFSRNLGKKNAVLRRI